MLRRFPAAICLAAALLIVLPPAPAPAQRGRDVAVRFTSFSPWTEPARPLRISLAVTNRAALPVEDLFVRLTFFRRVITRNELRRALDGQRSADVVAVTTEGLDQAIPPGGARTIRIERSLPGLSTAFRPGQGRSGVYPMDVELVDARGTLGRWHTAIAFLIVPPPARLNVAWIWTVHASPTLDRHGAVDPEGAADALGPGGLAQTVATLAAGRSAPVTIAPSGALLDALAALASGGTPAAPAGSPAPSPGPALPGPLTTLARKALDDLRLAASGPMQLALLPYGRADLSELWRAGLRGDVRRQIREGRAAAVRAFGASPGSGLLLPPRLRLDPEASRDVRALGIRRLVLNAADFPGVDDPVARGLGFGATRPVLVEGGDGARFEALLADPDIRARLARAGGDPMLQAQAVIAETAASFLEVPALADARLIVVAHDRTPDPAVARALLAGLGGAPWIRLRTASDAFREFPPEEDALRLPRVAAGRGPVLQAARRARDVVDRLREIVLDPAPEVALLDRLVLASESADWAENPRAGRRLASAARARTLEMLNGVRTADRHVTLTARTGELPVTLVNETGLRVRVRVRLEAVKVSFPRGATRTVVLGDRIRTLSFAAHARATGSFTVTVRLETPDRKRSIGTGEIVVRSTAVSAVTLIATGGGMLVLIAAWLRRDARRRRAGL